MHIQRKLDEIQRDLRDLHHQQKALMSAINDTNSTLGVIATNLAALTLAINTAIADLPPTTTGSGATETQVAAVNTTLVGIAGQLSTLATNINAAVGALNPGTVPTNVVATVSPGGTVGLVFTGVTGAQSYNVKRSSTAGGPYATVATVTSGGPFTEGGLPLNVPEFYVVSAVVNGTESANSAEVTATPVA